MIKLYTKTICPKCKLIKMDIANLPVNVEIINVEHNEEGMAAVKEQGYSTMPVMTDGKKWVISREDMLNMLHESM